MTCIVGIIDKKTETVYIAGDSAGVSGYDITHRKDVKVFKNGPFIMGFTSSFRMGQLLMSSKFDPPRQEYGQSDYDYMVTTFIDAVRKLFIEGGYAGRDTDGAETGGTFLVGYRGKLYYIEDDFQVGESIENYASCGCGRDYATGAFAILDKLELTPETDAHYRSYLIDILSMVTTVCGGVSAPFNIVSMSKEESDKELMNLKQI